MRVTYQGQVVALLNQPAIAATWQGLQAELRAWLGADSALLAAVAPGINQQVGTSGRLLTSLRYDYFYALLLRTPGPERAYPEFVDATSLYFVEQETLALAPAPGQWSRLAAGRLDEARTDRAAVARQLDAALVRQGHTASPTPATGLRFTSRTHTVGEVATGWPVTVESTLSCACPGSGYAKEYDLTIVRL